MDPAGEDMGTGFHPKGAITSLNRLNNGIHDLTSLINEDQCLQILSTSVGNI